MNLQQAIDRLHKMFSAAGQEVHTQRWQARDISKQPAGRMVELLHYTMVANLHGCVDPESYALDIKPNMPWAENHFLERVCRYPVNPGLEWANWPWAEKAKDSQDDCGVFNHNYMERYWPKLAGVIPTGTKTPDEFQYMVKQHEEQEPLTEFAPRGIRGQQLGDLENLISMLAKEPDTRQAYLPVWFPEDTGDANGGRKPCTLGYHFIMRNGRLDITYYIRACDLYHHFRDDVYLTVRLLAWVLERLQAENPEAWGGVRSGHLIMHITSLHCFVNDYVKLFGGKPG